MEINGFIVISPQNVIFHNNTVQRRKTVHWSPKCSRDKKKTNEHLYTQEDNTNQQ